MFGLKMKLAFGLAICLFGIVSNAMAACSPTTQNAVAPGDTISITGPAVPADQAALGVTYTYLWTIKNNSATGATLTTGYTRDAKDLSFTVPTTNYGSNYYVQLDVVAAQSPTACVNQVCLLFPVTPVITCTVSTSAPDTVCIADKTGYNYNTANPGSTFVERMWVFPPGVTVPAQVGYTDYTGSGGMANYKVADSYQTTINWNTQAGTVSGVYTVYAGIYSKNNKVWQSACTKQVTVIAVPSVAITVT